MKPAEEQLTELLYLQHANLAISNTILAEIRTMSETNASALANLGTVMTEVQNEVQLLATAEGTIIAALGSLEAQAVSGDQVTPAQIAAVTATAKASLANLGSMVTSAQAAVSSLPNPVPAGAAPGAPIAPAAVVDPTVQPVAPSAGPIENAGSMVVPASATTTINPEPATVAANTSTTPA